MSKSDSRGRGVRVGQRRSSLIRNWRHGPWSESPHVETILGWPRDAQGELRGWLSHRGFLSADRVKPDRPKEALEAVLRHVRRGRSAALYRKLADAVSLERCVDESFVKLRDTLGAWFPAP